MEESLAASLASKIASKAGDMALSRTVGVAAGATLGRIPVAGPFVAQATARVVTDELKKLAVSDTSASTSDKTDKQGDNQIDESMYMSAVENFTKESSPPVTKFQECLFLDFNLRSHTSFWESLTY